MSRPVSLLLAALAATALPALADGDDHDAARRALEQGEVLPLSRIMQIAEDKTGGRVIEVEFDRDDGRWLYELELVTPGGRLIELEFDGATGQILDREDEDRKEHD